PMKWTLLDGRAEATNGALLVHQTDGSWLATGANPDSSTYSLTSHLTSPVFMIRIEVLPDPSLVSNGPGRASSGNFILSKVRVFVDGKAVLPKSAQADFVQQGYSIGAILDDEPESGWAVADSYGKSHITVIELPNPARGKT